MNLEESLKYAQKFKIIQTSNWVGRNTYTHTLNGYRFLQHDSGVDNPERFLVFFTDRSLKMHYLYHGETFSLLMRFCKIMTQTLAVFSSHSW